MDDPFELPTLGEIEDWLQSIRENRYDRNIYDSDNQNQWIFIKLSCVSERLIMWGGLGF